MMHNDINVQVCDATGASQRFVDGIQKCILAMTKKRGPLVRHFYVM